MKFKRIDRGYFDPATGKSLKSIDGRKNRKGVNGFTHLGWNYPSVITHGYHIETRYEKDENILLLLDITEAEALNIQVIDSRYSAGILDEPAAINFRRNVMHIPDYNPDI